MATVSFAKSKSKLPYILGALGFGLDFDLATLTIE